MDRRGVPSAPINTYPQILADLQVAAMGLVVDLNLPNGVMTKTVRFPIRISGYEFDIYQAPPELGARYTRRVRGLAGSANQPWTTINICKTANVAWFLGRVLGLFFRCRALLLKTLKRHVRSC